MPTRQIKLSELSITPVHPSSPIPLYYQVEADLRERLRSASVTSGDLLPTELELARAYKVGRHTVRTALARLAADHLITRKAGHGTVVAPPQDRRQFSLAHSFTQQMRDMGLTPHSRVLHMQVGTIGANDPLPLQTKLGAPSLYLQRLRFGDDEPVGLQNTTVVTEQCAGLEANDFTTHSLYDILYHQFGLTITLIRHAVSAATADKKQADLLSIDVRAPLLVVNTSAFLDTGDIIESSTSYYRADKYEYTTTSSL